MLNYTIKKLKETIITLLILSLGVFMASHLAPGDPLASVYGDGVERLTKEERVKTINNLGLDKPLIVQYGIWIKNAVKGDLGYSYKYKMKVSSVILTHIPNTIILMGISMVITFVLAMILGIITALNEGKLLDRIIIRWNTLFYCIPSFWIALILILIFSTNLKLLPSSGVYSLGMENDLLDRIVHLILPVAVMIVGHFGYYSNFVRNKILEELKEDYIILAKAKGLSKSQIVFRHPLKKIMPSIITLMALSINHLIAGGFVVEYVFTYPGVGKLAFESAKFHDYPLLMGTVILTGFVVVLASFIADLFSSLIDPRLRDYGRN